MDVLIQNMLVRLGLSVATAQCLVNKESIKTPKAISQPNDEMIVVLCENCCELTPDAARAQTDSGQDLQMEIFQQKAWKQVTFFINCKFVTS